MSSAQNTILLIELRRAAISGKKKRVQALVKKLLDLGMSANKILEDGIVRGSEALSLDFAQGLCFVPEFLSASYGFRAALAALKPNLVRDGNQPVGTVILGTVKYDISHIGKAMVATAFEASNFRVVDLGVDVSADQFVKCAAELLETDSLRRVIVAMSCSHTTSLPTIGRVIEQLNSKGLRDQVKTIVGGAATNPEIANWYGSDSYGKDPYEGILQARRLFGHLSCVYQTYALPIELIRVTDTISIELIKYLDTHPEALYDIRPRQFEKLVAEILAHYGWQVHLTPATSDGGYDLFAISNDIAGTKASWIVECKKYAPERKVGIDVVRSLYCIKTDLHVGNILLATTSHFTKGVEKFKASHYDLELKEYKEIVDWIRAYQPRPNGRLYIEDSET